jgi:hypothetical protein
VDIRPALGAVALFGLLVLTSLLVRPERAALYYLALLLAGLALLPLVVRAVAGTLDLFEPIIPISLLIVLAYSVRTMYIAYVPRSIGFGSLAYDDQIAAALLLTMAAYLALVFGYYVLGGALRPKPMSERWFAGRRWAPALPGWKILVLLGIGTYATRVAAASGTGLQDVTAATTLIGFAASSLQIAACILALHAAAGHASPWLRFFVWGVAVPLAAWQALTLGGKAYLLSVVYIVIAARHYVSQRTRLGIVLAITGVAVLTVFPIINVLRVDDPRTVARGALVERVAAVLDGFAGMTPAEYMRFAAENTMTRFNGVDALALSMKYNVSDELGNPMAYAYIPFYAFVPRLVWPDKPVLDQGVRFGQILLIGGFAGASSVTSIGMYHLADLFVSFGAIGVLIGMMVLGCLYRLVYAFLDPLHTPDAGVKFLYILVLWAMVSGFETDVPTVYSGLLKFLPLWMAIKLWMSRPLPSTALRRPAAPDPVRSTSVGPASAGDAAPLHRQALGR